MSQNSFLSVVENHYNSNDCCQRCNDNNNNSKYYYQRNILSTCWVQCFTDATLEKNITTTYYKNSNGGMTREELSRA